MALSILCTALLAGWYASGTVQFAAERYEASPIFQASKLFPPGLVKGPNHQVDERVLNDGYMNHYRIHTRFGDLNATSTAELKIRIDEANTLATMEKVKARRSLAVTSSKAARTPWPGGQGPYHEPHRDRERRCLRCRKPLRARR